MAKCKYVLELAKQYLNAAEVQLAQATSKKEVAEKYLSKTAKDY